MDRNGIGACRGSHVSWVRLRWVRRGATLLAFLAAVEYLVLPQIAGTRAALHVLGNVQPGWVVLGVAFEILSFVSYSLLTCSVLPDTRPPYWWVLRTDLTALGLSHIVPGGAASASPLRYRLLREGGTPAEDAIVGATVEGVGSTLVLVGLLWIALVMAIPFVGVRTTYLVAAGFGAAFIAAVVLAALGLSRGMPGAGTVTHGVVRLFPAKLRGRVEHALVAAVSQLGDLLADRQELRRSGLWAAGSWLLDASSLWVFLVAFGCRPNPIGLLVGYALANLVAVLPISPGGLGVIEGILIPSLVGFGAPRAAAVLGVVSWRLFNFWLPIPGAGLCYFSLRSQDWRGTRTVAARWRGFLAFFADQASSTDPPVPITHPEGDRA
jgi:uncharacterized protein (TIRG00374 family)